ncbi:uncharacterized protein LOC143916060 isoform X2 [Arctopsyche grandis]|uniref:uncharacterized protein LOC143916060 isoform X2 n=1 Tax=Arctopsyche grandis TaxID=121162 RepID=UPI00406D739A
MSISANNNKETFKLLDLSSDTDSDNLQIEIVPRKKRINRSRNSGGSNIVKSEAWGQKAIAIGITAALLAWLVALSWAAAALSEDTRRLDAAIREVSVGSQGVGDALQRCHSTARELQHNHTEMAAKLDKLILRTDNLTSQVTALQAGLAGVKQQVASAPELVSVPEQLTSLGANVARFGSQIKDFDSTVASLRAQSTAVSDGQVLLQNNITQLKTQIDQILNTSLAVDGVSNAKSLEPYIKQQSDLQTALTQLSANISLINETLATKINWATQDFQNDHHKVTGLLESVQNNSAALSSLHTAWRQGSDVLTRNVTALAMKIAEKSSELQSTVEELKRLKEQLSHVEAKQHSDLTKESNSNSIPIDVDDEKEDVQPNDILSKPQYVQPPVPIAASQTMKTLHERDSESDLSKVLGSTLAPIPSTTKATTITSRVATGKPSILSSSGSA